MDSSTLSAADIYAFMLGLLVAQLREQRSWTQASLAERIGVTQSTLSRIERGQAQPDAFTMRSIEQAFDLNIGELANLVDEAQSKAAEVARKAVPGPKAITKKESSPWWVVAMPIIGVVGLLGLLAVAVGMVFQARRTAMTRRPKAAAPRANSGPGGAGGERSAGTPGATKSSGTP